MGTLTVYFVGICTHLREFTSREVEHRVVLINGRGGKTINGNEIVGHEASLRYLDADGKPQKESLNGVHITVNAVDPKVVYDRSFFTCIPRLTAFAPSLPSLGMDAAQGRDANLAAAYFDAAGRFVAGADANDASVAVLNVVTQDPPTLTLANFDGTSRPPIELPDGAEIQIENVGPGKGGGDQTHDFLLNFLVAQNIPTDASWPTKRAHCYVCRTSSDPTSSCKLDVRLPFPGNTVDVGCSNSNYP
jgi:hypothetical protein